MVNVLFLGVVKNVESVIKTNINKVFFLMNMFEKSKLVIYENNSTDNTKNILKEFSEDERLECIMEDFIERYCSKLNINQELTKCCKFIALRIQKNNMIPENTPHSIAAGIVYFIAQICKLNISKKDVNKVSEISEVTINKCFKKLEGIQEKLVPKAITDKYI